MFNIEKSSLTFFVLGVGSGIRSRVPVWAPSHKAIECYQHEQTYLCVQVEVVMQGMVDWDELQSSQWEGEQANNNAAYQLFGETEITFHSLLILLSEAPQILIL